MFWMAFIGSFVISSAAKIVADLLLSERTPLLWGAVGLQYVGNQGIAFGVFLQPLLQSILIACALAAASALALRTRHALLEKTGFGLLLGGAWANVLDRLGDDSVTDFIRLGAFPIFNVADSAITIGVTLLLVHATLARRKIR